MVDPFGGDVEPGGVGELVLRGETIMKGYWNKPGETAEAIRDGWLHTGDLARIDADGYLTLVDRLKDLIITAGRNGVTAAFGRRSGRRAQQITPGPVPPAHVDDHQAVSPMWFCIACEVPSALRGPRDHVRSHVNERTNGLDRQWGTRSALRALRPDGQ